MPSTTTKSLPCPCILVNLSFTRLFSLVRVGLARRAGLEALVRPEVLLRHLAHALLDERVHAAHVGLEVLRGVIVPCRVEARDVAVTLLARDHRNHRRTADAREPRQRR